MAPVHTPVLEWLAHDFVAEGGHYKSLIRKIVASSVYQQSSHTDDSRGVAIDPENRLLWRQRLRRLESESIRDALLAASGQLERSIGGPPIPVEPKPDGSFVVKQQGLPPGTSALRRSLYLLSRRNYHPTLLAAFDQPALTTNCTYRPPSAVVLQSLTMLNDPFVLEQAAALADRIRRASDPSTEARVAAAFLLTLGRPPSPHETQWCVDTWRSEANFHRRADPHLAPDEIERRALTRIAHTLLNTSEVLYVP
jgi:hypothetical protein